MRWALVVLVLGLAGLSGSVWPASQAQALVSLGGDLFFQSRQPFGWSLDDLTFADANNVWATACNYADGYWLMHSRDAGMTWQRVDAGVGFGIRIKGLEFFGPDHGRALTTWRDEDGTGHVGVLATDDGGVTWTFRPIASPDLAPSGGCDFVSPDIAFIAAREREATRDVWHTRLLSTTDGGATWMRAAIGCASASNLVATDARHLWLLDSESKAVWTSSTGGGSWHAHPPPLKSAADHFSVGLQAVSAKVAWISVLRYGGVHWHHLAMRTSNAGRSWQTVRRIEEYGEPWLTAVSPSEAWLAVEVDPVCPQHPAYFDHTTDGGVTWTRTYAGVSATGAVRVSPDGSLVAGSLYDFAWIGHGDGLSRSTDGGATWTSLIGDRFGYWLNDIASRPGADLWAVGWTTPSSPGIYGGYGGDEGLLLRCRDGVTWVRQDVPEGPMLCGIDFVGGETGWAVGWNGRVLRTTDGGVTWTALSAGEGYDMRAVEALDAQSAVALARDEDGAFAVLRTTDGGASWAEELRTSDQRLTSVCVVAPGHLLIVGTEYGPKQLVLLESTDSGATWSERLIPCQWSARDVTFSDPTRGWILLSDAFNPFSPPSGKYGSVVMRTTDGGASWQTTDLGKVSWAGLTAIAFADGTNGWVLGDKELRTTDGGVNWSDTGARMPSSADVLDWPEPVVRAAVVVGSDLWAVGADQLILSTVDTCSDTAPPLSSDDGDRRWHNGAVATRILAADPGGEGVASTQVRIDSGSWQALGGPCVEIDAPSDHSGDGTHRIEYRSLDNAGNLEFPRACLVRIDTRRPSTRVGARVSVESGRVAKLRYRVSDAKPNGGTARVTISIRRAGLTVKTLHLGVQPVNKWLVREYRCRLAPKVYRYLVTATDQAGNKQRSIGRGRLVVK